MATKGTRTQKEQNTESLQDVDSRTNGSFPKGARRLSENSPAGYPPPHHRDARAPGRASSHDAATPTSQYCRSTRAPLVIEGTPSLFVSIRGSSSFPKRKRPAVYPVYPVHPCSIYSPSRLIFPVAGLGWAQRPDSQSASRAAASGPINPVPDAVTSTCIQRLGERCRLKSKGYSPGRDQGFSK